MTKKTFSNVRALLVAGMVVAMPLGLSGCETVSAWERKNLARPEMGWTPDALDGQLADHVYFSKEGSNGGGKAVGGGCGCN
ncbi:MAG: DUF4266 domain-containing protein [Pseudomonadales bacterium]